MAGKLLGLTHKRSSAGGRIPSVIDEPLTDDDEDAIANQKRDEENLLLATRCYGCVASTRN